LVLLTAKKDAAQAYDEEEEAVASPTLSASCQPAVFPNAISPVPETSKQRAVMLEEHKGPRATKISINFMQIK
jgi:hypothetical protein